LLALITEKKNYPGPISATTKKIRNILLSVNTPFLVQKGPINHQLSNVSYLTPLAPGCFYLQDVHDPRFYRHFTTP